MSKLVLTGFCSSSPQQNHKQNKKKVVVTDFMFVVVCEMEVAKIQYHNIEYRNKTFEIDYTLRYFKSVCWHQQPPDNQTIKNWHQVSMQFWKIWSTRFFGTQLRGDQNLLFTVGGFFQQERVLWGWLTGPSHTVCHWGWQLDYVENKMCTLLGRHAIHPVFF